MSCRDVLSPSGVAPSVAVDAVESSLSTSYGALHREREIHQLVDGVCTALRDVFAMHVEDIVHQKLTLQTKETSVILETSVPVRSSFNALPTAMAPEAFYTDLMQQWCRSFSSSSMVSRPFEENRSVDSSLISHLLQSIRWSMDAVLNAVDASLQPILYRTAQITQKVKHLTRCLQAHEDQYHRVLRLMEDAAQLEQDAIGLFQQSAVEGRAVSDGLSHPSAPSPNTGSSDNAALTSLLSGFKGVSPQDARQVELCRTRLEQQRRRALQQWREENAFSFFMSETSFRVRHHSRELLAHLPPPLDPPPAFPSSHHRRQRP